MNIFLSSILLMGIIGHSTLAQSVRDCEGALVKSTYSSISASHQDTYLATLVTEEQFKEITHDGSLSVPIYGITAKGDYSDFQRDASSKLSQSNSKMNHDEAINILWTGLDPNASSGYTRCLETIAASGGLHTTVRSATESDIAIVVTWVPIGPVGSVLPVTWSGLSKDASGNVLPKEVTAGRAIVIVPRPKMTQTLAINAAGFGDSITLTPLLIVPPPRGSNFREKRLAKDLLVGGSVSNVHPGPGTSCNPINCINGLTFDRPYFRAASGVDMNGVSAPDNTFGIGIHPMDKSVAHASFNIPQGARWFRGYIGLARDGVCGKDSGDATVIISLSKGPAVNEVKHFDLRGMDGPVGNAESLPIPLNGMERIIFEVDSNGDFNCDNVFIAGARFTAE